MTELTEFLASLYDSFSEAEMQALQHGHQRLAELLESGTVPDDVAVPVYHASEVEVTLDVGLVAEETKRGTEVFVTDADEGDASQLTFSVDLFELLEREDLDDLEGLVPADDGPSKARERADEDPSTVANESIDAVEDIDPEHRAALEAVGVERLTDLVDRSPTELSAAVEREGVEVSPETTAAWLDEARGLIALLSEGDEALPVELVDGIGPVFGTRLRDAGITALSTLVERSPEEIAEAATSESVSVSSERAGRWIDEASTKLRALEDVAAMRPGTEADELSGEIDTTEDEK
jgi:predicted flap endonuclease-1-like 5' DNA nuclease